MLTLNSHVFLALFVSAQADRVVLKSANKSSQDVATNLPQPTVGSEKVLFHLDARTSLLEPLPYNQQFADRKPLDYDEGTAVLGVEGVDIVTSRTSPRDRLDRLVRVTRPSPSLRPSTSSSPPHFTKAKLSLPMPTLKLQDRNVSLLTAGSKFPEENAETRPQPALYARLSALGASLGFVFMMIMKCKGLLAELAPKAPLSGFVRSHLDRPTRGSGEHGRKRARGGARFCSSRVSRAAPSLTTATVTKDAPLEQAVYSSDIVR